MGSLSKITIHWTAGTYTPNDVDKKAYHFLVDGNGKIIKGKYKPTDNINCQDGVYAAHCGGGNTGNIGIGICAMWDSKAYPIKRCQIEAACKLAAELSKTYGIPISTTNIFTHAEFGNRYPNSTSRGKRDIDSLPCVCVYGVQQVGNWIRDKVHWYKVKYYG